MSKHRVKREGRKNKSNKNKDMLSLRLSQQFGGTRLDSLYSLEVGTVRVNHLNQENNTKNRPVLNFGWLYPEYCLRVVFPQFSIYSLQKGQELELVLKDGSNLFVTALNGKALFLYDCALFVQIQTTQPCATFAKGC